MKRTVPIRRCIGCGKREKQQNLLRFTAGPEGSLRPGAGNGRGAYLHPYRACIRAFTTARSKFIRSLRRTISREARECYATQIENSLTL